MRAYEMQRRLQCSGASTLSLATHPGGTKSELSRNNVVLKFIDKLSGALIQDTEAGTMSAPAVKQRFLQRSHDKAVATRVWQSCEQLTGVRWLD